MNIDTLYIIGNGFDLYHNLPTSYRDFHKYLVTSNTELENNLEEYFNFRISKNYTWTNFEEDLGTFNWKAFFDDNFHVHPLDDDFKISSTYSVEDNLGELSDQLISDIRNAFSGWLETIELEFTTKKLKLPKGAFYINFNYTLTLEQVYKIQNQRVFNIHKNIESEPETLVFGHNTVLKEIPELDEKGDSNRTLFTDSEGAAKRLQYHFIKPVEDIICENDKLFTSFFDVKNIFVLGHSLNQIDMPYFKKVFDQAQGAKWQVSFYQNREHHLTALKQIGISYDSIRMFEFGEDNEFE